MWSVPAHEIPRSSFNKTDHATASRNTPLFTRYFSSNSRTMAFIRPAARAGSSRISASLCSQFPHSARLSTASAPPGKYDSPTDTASSEALQHFSVEREQYVPELDVLARIYRHKGTGGQLLSLRGDAHKTFAIAFRTPAENSNGVAHIMEHSVLCGSEKYPSKEPFVDLLKSSLYTFLNAMTYPDR